MTETPLRVFAAFCVLVALWIAVYWWWEPAGEAPISFAPPAAPAADDFPAPSDDPPPAPAAAPRRPAAEPVRRDAAAGRVVPPSFQEYTVEDGETLRSIALKFYGDRRHWEAIARANPLMDPERLRAGRVIRIPTDPANVQGRVAAAGDAAAAGVVTYVVRKGDVLGSIARDHYGSTKHAAFLFEYNRERLGLRDMNSIREGHTLLVPPLPDSQR